MAKVRPVDVDLIVLIAIVVVLIVVVVVLKASVIGIVRTTLPLVNPSLSTSVTRTQQNTPEVQSPTPSLW